MNRGTSPGTRGIASALAQRFRFHSQFVDETIAAGHPLFLEIAENETIGMIAQALDQLFGELSLGQLRLVRLRGRRLGHIRVALGTDVDHLF